MPITQIESIAELANYAGKEVGISDWLEVSQDRINQFAEASEDRQWIHIDPERAANESPFKTTIAHGFLTLSLLSVLARHAISVGGESRSVCVSRSRRCSHSRSIYTCHPGRDQRRHTIDVERHGRA